MRKIINIGRDPQSDIVISDSRDVVSRCHAILYIEGCKIFIEDRSKNGTYINGVRINTGTKVPVTRNNKISFAHVANLDWSKVPNPIRKMWISVVAAVLVILITFFSYTKRESIKGFFKHEPEIILVTDTLHVVDTVTIQKTIEKIIIKESAKPIEARPKSEDIETIKENTVDESPIF